jgi:hypothetical protein
VSSLLDHDENTWHERIRWGCKDTRARRLVGYAYRAVADLAEAGGWEAEYPRDVWRMRRLGYDGDRTLRFAAIQQPWLRDLTNGGCVGGCPLDYALRLAAAGRSS